MPENADSHVASLLTIVSKTVGCKVLDVKTLYGLRLLLKKKMAEYNNVFGKDLDPKQAMQILWASMDSRSKEIAMPEKLDEKTYQNLHLHMDMLYKITFGHMDYKSTSTDDPMGMVLMAERKDFFEAPKLTGNDSGAPQGAGRRGLQ